MKKIYVLSTAMLGLIFVSPAFAEDMVSVESKSNTTMEKDADGNYQKKITRSAESVDAAGTKTKSEVKVQVESDAEGNGERKVTTKTSSDPEGLMNKSKTEEISSVKYKDGEVEKKYQKKVDGKTVEKSTETVAN